MVGWWNAWERWGGGVEVNKSSLVVDSCFFFLGKSVNGCLVSPIIG